MQDSKDTRLPDRPQTVSLDGTSPGLSHRELLEHLHDGVYYVDADRRILYWNEAAEELTGFRREEVVGQFCHSNILQHVDANGRPLCVHDCPLAQSLKDGQRRTHRMYLHHREGHRVPVTVRISPVLGPEGDIVGAVEGFSNDVWREDLQERITELERLALIDGLTGLPNRRCLEQQLEARLDENRRYGWPFGVLLLDLDDFKRVNDTHGHEVGDRVIQMVAHTLSAATRLFDVVGRWGGEEYLAAVTNVELDRLIPIGQRFYRMVAASQLRDSPRVKVTCSIGAACVRHGESLADLIRRADLNLYRAKSEGGNRLCA